MTVVLVGGAVVLVIGMIVVIWRGGSTVSGLE
jgi:hypothetical protein